MDTEKAKTAILIIVLVIVVIAFTLQLNTLPSIRVQSDLFSRWYATRQLLESGRNIYDVKNMEEAVDNKTIPTTPLETGFFYPAHLLVFLAPLAILPYPVAHFIWTLAGQLFFLIGLWIIIREVHWPATLNKQTLIIFLALFFIPFIQHTIWSQFDTLAVIGIAMVFRQIRREHYFAAGLWASLITFKPQDGFLTLMFFLFWSSFALERRRFIAGFIIAAFGLWAFAQSLQPGWVGDFLQALASYRNLPYKPFTITSSMGILGNIIGLIFILITLYIFFYYRKEEINTAGFYFSIVMSLSAFWILLPVIGMMNLVLMPVGIVFMLAGAERLNQRIYRSASILLLVTYVVGYAGFIIGLLTPKVEGDHIFLAELVYRLFAPMLIVAIVLFASARQIFSRRFA